MMDLAYSGLAPCVHRCSRCWHRRDRTWQKCCECPSRSIWDWGRIPRTAKGCVGVGMEGDSIGFRVRLCPDSLEWRMEIVGYTKKLDFVKYLNGDKISGINRKTPINQNIEGVTSITSLAAKLLRYDTRCYFNVQSKAGMS